MGIEERFKQFEKFIKTDLPAQKSLQHDRTIVELSASLIQTPQGDYMLKETRYGPGDTHGDFSFANLDLDRRLSFDNFSCSPVEGEFSLRDIVVIDTETTGLSGGVGTVAFLVGLGYFENDQYVVRQHFLPDFSEEEGFLNHLFDDLPGNVMVSFNGRAFDLPLLVNRFLIQKLGSEFFGRDHLDVLFTLRRFYRLRLPDCTLKTAESSLLNFERLNDIPSEQIPQTYFDYLRTGQTREIYQVIVHNLWDIVSTLGVMLKLHGYVEKAIDSEDLTDCESWSMGKFYLGRRDFEKALASFSKSRDEGGDYHYRNIFEASLIARRLKDYETAINYWEMLTDAVNPYYLHALQELAKAHEHRLKNHETAIKYCEKARETIYQLSQLEPDTDFSRFEMDFEKRLSRLRTKLRKSQ